jgi:hypothetical protein
MPKPTTKAVSIEGAMISSSTKMELRAKSMAEAGSMFLSKSGAVFFGGRYGCRQRS